MPTGYPSPFQALRLYTPPLFHPVFTRFILAFPFHIGGVGRPTLVSLKSYSVMLNTTLLYHVEGSLILRTSEVARPNSLLFPVLGGREGVRASDLGPSENRPENQAALKEVGKLIQHCEKNLNQHHSTGWPNTFNMLNSTMLNGAKWKCLSTLSDALH